MDINDLITIFKIKTSGTSWIYFTDLDDAFEEISTILEEGDEIEVYLSKELVTQAEYDKLF